MKISFHSHANKVNEKLCALPPFRNEIRSNWQMAYYEHFIAFDEEERILIVSFLPKSLSRVLWTSAAGIDRDARRFQRLGAILDWLTGTYSLDLMCCFLGRGELEFTRAVKLPLEVERSNALY